MEGLEGPIYFDALNNVTQPSRVGRHVRGAFVSAPQQLAPASAASLAGVDADAALAAGELLDVAGNRYWRQRVVYAGLDMTRVERVDELRFTFSADFLLWLRYPGDDAAAAVEFPDAREATADVLEDSADDGTGYRLYRVRGEFDAALDLRDYPFDVQRLAVRFQNRRLPRERLVYAVDRAGLRLDADPSKIREQLAAALRPLPAWRFLDAAYSVDDLRIDSTRGRAALVDQEATSDSPGFTLEIRVERHAQPVLLRQMLPLGLLALVLGASLYFPAELRGERVGLAVTALLAAAVLLDGLRGQLPDVGYPVAIEYLFWAFFVLCLACLIFPLAAARLGASARVARLPPPRSGRADRLRRRRARRRGGLRRTLRHPNRLSLWDPEAHALRRRRARTREAGLRDDPDGGPALHAWAAPARPRRLVEQAVAKADPDPTALACSGLLVRWWDRGPSRPPREDVWLRFVDGRPLSASTTQCLAWSCARLAAAGTTALVLVWDKASWHLSADVRTWIADHNRRARTTGTGVRSVPRPLPTKRPWLNPREPEWVHGKRKVVEPARLLPARELAERVCAVFDCPYEPHLVVPNMVA